MINPPGHLWRDKWTALSGPLSEEVAAEEEEANRRAAQVDVRGARGETALVALCFALAKARAALAGTHTPQHT